MNLLKINFLIFILISSVVYGQNYNIDQHLDKIPSSFELIGISSKDNSKIYRYKESFPTTVFSFDVDKYEIKIHKNIIVGLHFVLLPKDKNNNVPYTLIDKVSQKSGIKPIFKNSKYYFDDITSKTQIFRQYIPDYGGDRIHIMITSTKYLYK